MTLSTFIFQASMESSEIGTHEVQYYQLTKQRDDWVFLVKLEGQFQMNWKMLVWDQSTMSFYTTCMRLMVNLQN